MSAYTDRIDETRIEARLADMAEELKTYAERLKMSIHIETCYVDANEYVAAPTVHLFPGTELMTIRIENGEEMLGAIEKAKDIKAKTKRETNIDD